MFGGEAAAADESEKQIAVFLKDSLRELERYRKAIDDSAFDVDTLSKKLGEDVETIFSFVQNEIAYEPYYGALRGPTGCLTARGGNSVDKSLLLVKLLKKAGHEARYAFGTLSKEQAFGIVVDSLRWEVDEQSAAIGLPYYYQSQFVEEKRKKAETSIESRIQGRLDKLSRTACQAFGKQLSAKAGGIDVASLAGEVQQHVWVQVKIGEKYVDLDPSNVLAEPGDTLVAADKTTATISKDLWHYITFRAVQENFDGKKVSDSVLWSKQYKAADLAGLPIVVSCSKVLDGFSSFREALSGDDKRCVRMYVDGKMAVAKNFN